MTFEGLRQKSIATISLENRRAGYDSFGSPLLLTISKHSSSSAEDQAGF
jgi:hypothetical protein